MKAIMISIQPKYVADILNKKKTLEIRKTCPEIFKHLKSYEGCSIDVYVYCKKGKETLWRHNNLNTFGELSKDVEKQFCAYGKNEKELNDKLLDFLYKNGIRVGISKSVHATLLNGKVVAKFTLNKVEELTFLEGLYSQLDRGYCTDTLDNAQVEMKSCVSQENIIDYLFSKGQGYAWHIDDLVIFDKPKEISEFKRCTEKVCIFSECHKYMHCLKPLTRAPQSWQFIEV